MDSHLFAHDESPSPTSGTRDFLNCVFGSYISNILIAYNIRLLGKPDAKSIFISKIIFMFNYKNAVPKIQNSNGPTTPVV